MPRGSGKTSGSHSKSTQWKAFIQKNCDYFVQHPDAPVAPRKNP